MKLGSSKSFSGLMGRKLIFFGVPGGVLKYEPESSWCIFSIYSATLLPVIDWADSVDSSTTNTSELMLSSGLSGLSGSSSFRILIESCCGACVSDSIDSRLELSFSFLQLDSRESVEMSKHSSSSAVASFDECDICSIIL